MFSEQRDDMGKGIDTKISELDSRARILKDTWDRARDNMDIESDPQKVFENTVKAYGALAQIYTAQAALIEVSIKRKKSQGPLSRFLNRFEKV